MVDGVCRFDWRISYQIRRLWLRSNSNVGTRFRGLHTCQTDVRLNVARKQTAINSCCRFPRAPTYGLQKSEVHDAFESFLRRIKRILLW